MAAGLADYRSSSTGSFTPEMGWVEDIPEWLAHNWDWFDPSHAHRLFWPRVDSPPVMDILVAGCGPSQAAVIAYNNPQAHVTAIDIDEAALNHETYLRHKHMLLNLDTRVLRPSPVEDVAALGKSFDLIIASGVLQYLDSPQTGLSALASSLRPNGVIAVMVPSDQTLDSAIEGGGSGRSFSVLECLDLVENAGLVFQDWFHKAPYYPPGLQKFDDERLISIARLPERQMWSVMEPLRNQTGRHLFMACKPERPERDYRIHFTGSQAAHHLPEFGSFARIGQSGVFRPGCSVTLQTRDVEMALSANGQRSISEIAEQVEIGVDDAVEFFNQLWRMDFVTIRLAD